MDKNKLEEISALVYDLIERKVAQENQNTEYKEKFDNLVYELNHLVEQAQEVAEDYKDRGLAFNTIEAEGFLRAMLTVQSVIGNYK